MFFVLSYLAGALTIVSPCILPVLPFVFASGTRPFRRGGLPLLIGLAATFALVGSVATLGGNWLTQANEAGRWLALSLLALFGLMLLSSGLAERAMQPLVRLGEKLAAKAGEGGGFAGSFVLGIATGLLWAPCAGPVLGLILTGAALSGANARTVLLLLAYAAGAATSLAVALLAGSRVFTWLKRYLGADRWVRRGLGVAVLLGVAIIATGMDRGLLTRYSAANTDAIEQWLIARLPTGQAPAAMTGSGSMTGSTGMTGTGIGTGEPTDSDLLQFAGAVSWLNSAPLDAAALKGKVVVVDFWTYSCINCLRSIPYTEAWARKYADQGLVVIGVHSPEFAFERDPDNVKRAIRDLGITYPVAIDNDYAIWRAFQNQYWPAHYFFDATGRIRYQHFGEGKYEQSEGVIQGLLAERNGAKPAVGFVQVNATGSQAASDETDLQSPETYIGYRRTSDQFASAGGLKPDEAVLYAAPGDLPLNDWALAGNWTVKPEQATLNEPSGRLLFKFHARDLHLVLGPSVPGQAIRFRVTIDGAPPGEDRGADIAADGTGMIDGQRLYQLVRQSGAVRDRLFEIEFLDPGAQAYAFTFG
ncbi:cytochrome C biogenesis protein DipZ [Hypericibacter adhaerens]|uniref:Cytochrome C biogenesis protein DipZ n=1 Tax=Hypericibacter adhaerens TaxID=2602016 RepID=A0A5J6MT09_9PROT|nr:cytochrome c biogenesis protein DipZ [Hypericibacter adhaerens]QEX20728.1 cytochrome C biogenesis protein DipZ [Hypericibacter adhaerens]